MSDEKIGLKYTVWVPPAPGDDDGGNRGGAKGGSGFKCSNRLRSETRVTTCFLPLVARATGFVRVAGADTDKETGGGMSEVMNLFSLAVPTAGT